MEKISFQNSAGLNLVGVLHKPTTPTNLAVVIAHGFTSNKDRARHIQVAGVLASSGIAAFRFDFGGSGESDDREVTVKSEINDLLAAIDLLKNAGYSGIGVLGESLGALVALEAFNNDFRTMVLWAPVTNKLDKHAMLTTDQAKQIKLNGFYIRHKDNREFRIPVAHLEEMKNVDRKSILGKITIPVLIVHSTADKVLPLNDSREAIGLLPKDSKLEIIDNWEHGGHKMDESMDIIIPKTVAWFEEHLIR